MYSFADMTRQNIFDSLKQMFSKSETEGFIYIDMSLIQGDLSLPHLLFLTWQQFPQSTFKIFTFNTAREQLEEYSSVYLLRCTCIV